MSAPIKLAIVGVGNCANSLLQGLAHYRTYTPEPGLIHPEVGSYKVSDIEVVAAFDVIEGKVGQPLPKAMWAFPNDTFRFCGDIQSPVIVSRGPTADGLGFYLSKYLTEDHGPAVDVAQVLRASGANILVNYLPVGSTKATELYAQAALDASCAMVNCIPVFLASDPVWSQKFRDRALPIIGDDIKSQVGATIVHRVLASLFKHRGVSLDRTLQLNIGGNGDFLNMLERERLASKKISKTNAVIAVAGTPIAPEDIHVGPSDYVQWLGDRKWAYIRLEGRGFGGAPLNIEMKLEVWDSPNSAGVVIDAVRCAKIALDNGLSGPVTVPSACFMKSPPIQMEDDVAFSELEKFIQE